MTSLRSAGLVSLVRAAALAVMVIAAGRPSAVHAKESEEDTLNAALDLVFDSLFPVVEAGGALPAAGPVEVHLPELGVQVRVAGTPYLASTGLRYRGPCVGASCGLGSGSWSLDELAGTLSHRLAVLARVVEEGDVGIWKHEMYSATHLGGMSVFLEASIARRMFRRLRLPVMEAAAAQVIARRVGGSETFSWANEEARFELGLYENLLLELAYAAVPVEVLRSHAAQFGRLLTVDAWRGVADEIAAAESLAVALPRGAATNTRARVLVRRLASQAASPNVRVDGALEPKLEFAEGTPGYELRMLASDDAVLAELVGAVSDRRLTRCVRFETGIRRGESRPYRVGDLAVLLLRDAWGGGEDWPLAGVQVPMAAEDVDRMAKEVSAQLGMRRKRDRPSSEK